VVVSNAVDRDALEAFVTVARTGTVREAAARLGRTQPSISARLAALEAGWSVRLFYRRPRGMEPTPEARALLPLAARALAALDEVDHHAGRPVTPAGEVRVGCGDALGRHVLPGALRRLQAETPALVVRVREGPRADLVEALRRGDLDLALIAAGADSGEGPDLETTTLPRSPVLLMTAPDDPAARASVVPLGDLSSRRVVTLLRGSSFRGAVDRAFAAAGIEWRPAVEVGSFSLVRRYVAAGLGVAPVPAVAFADEPPATTTSTVPLDGFPAVDYDLVRRAAAPLATPALRLIELLDTSGPVTDGADRSGSGRPNPET
jgi:DNA-binding transcriptional LysR family regulator